MDPAVSVTPDSSGHLALPDGCQLAWWRFTPPSGAVLPRQAPRLLVIWGAFATARHFDDYGAWLSRARGVEVLLYHHRGVAA
jgi:predicted alpha/beta hydrolase